MASKAYVASMTVAELTAELKKRGLNCKGKKKTLQNRLEQALYDEENSETSSESNEEATIRAASAVINQLEGPLNETLPTEELIVSIEHSKRTREPNEEPVIHNNHNTNDIYVHVPTDVNEQPSEQQYAFPDHVTLESSCPSADSVPQENLVPQPTLYQTQEPMAPVQTSVLIGENLIPPSASSILYQAQEPVAPFQTSVLIEENLIPPSASSIFNQAQEPVAPVQTSVLIEENLVSPPASSILYQAQEPVAPVQTSVLIEENVHDSIEDKVKEAQTPEETIPIGEISNVQEAEKSEDFSQYINIPSKSPIDTPSIEESSIILPETSESIEERLVILPVSENPPPSSLGSTPVSSAGPNLSLVVPSVSPGSAGDLESESEVNSIAVEPPSPIRDEISMVLEEGSVSFLKEESTPQPPEVPEVTEQIEEEPKTLVKEVPMETSAQEDVTYGDSKESDIAAVLTEDVVPSADTVSSSLPDSVIDEGNLGKSHVTESQQVVSSDSGVDSGHIELDVVVPTVEDDDFSVFSVEAAEAQQKLDTAPGSSQKRPSSLSNFASNGRSGNDLGGVVSKNETIEQARKRQSSVPDSETQESNETSITKRRRISTSPRRSQERRRRWGSSTSRTPTSTQLAISSDTLETIIPEEVKEEVAETLSSTALEAVMEYEMEEETMPDNSEEMEEKDKRDEPKQDDEDIVDLGKESSMIDEYEREWQEKEREKELQKREAGRAKHEQETRRKLEARLNSQQREERQPLKPRSPSPARNSPSRILHIENLTRPFTILQLRELLQEDGSIVEGGFWTNRIKSHCIAIYSSTDMAIATRNRLHGLKWPSTNPKLLRSDFLNNKMVTEISEGQMIIESRSPSPVKEEGSHDNLEPTNEPPIMITKKEEIKKDPIITIKPEEKPKEEKPTRVLDDLFRKTKTTPSIYWLQLSPEEIEVKEKEREAREIEREKRRIERQKEREKEMEEIERERRERERRIREERERRAKERINRRSRSRSPRQSRSRSRTPRRSHSRSISPRRRR